MKRKELFRRLSAISMAAMMTVTAVPANTFAADLEFTDSEQETAETDTADADIAEADTTDIGAEEEPQADVEEPEIEDTQESESGADEVDVFSDGDEEAAGETVEFQAEEGETTPAADATVHMTVSLAGVLADAKDGTAMAERDVTVKDLDSNGILTYDEALAAAHDAYYEGGAEAGYASEDSQYGLSLKKLWGDTSGAFGYWLNDTSCNSLSDEVKADDDLTAFVYKDQSAWSDSYTRFGQKEYQATAGKAFTVSVDKASYDMESSKYVFAAYEGAGLTAYDSEYKPLAADAYSVDGYNVTFNQAGTYYLATAGTDNASLVPAIAKVTVGAAENVEKKQYLKSLNCYWKSSTNFDDFTNVLEADKNTCEYKLRVDRSSVYVWPELSDDAPEGSTIQVNYTNANGRETSKATKPGTKTPLFSVARTGSMEKGSTLTFTVGVEGNVQTYTLDIGRLCVINNLEITKKDGTALPQFDGVFYLGDDDVPDALQVKAKSYEAELTINGKKTESDTACEIPIAFDENGECLVTIIASYGEESVTETYKIKKLTVDDVITGKVNNTVSWSLKNGVLTFTGTGAVDSTTSVKPLAEMVKEVVFSEGITSICKSAFNTGYNNQYTALEKVTFPESLTEIGEEAFKACALKEVTIPDSVTSLGRYAFYSNKSLETVTTGILSYSAFGSCDNLKNLTLKSGLTEIPEWAFSNSSLEKLEIPDTVKTISQYAFYQCAGLTEVSIPEGVTSLDGAFYECRNIQKAILPSTLESVNGKLFLGSTKLTDVQFNGDKYVVDGKLVYTKDKKNLVWCLPSCEGKIEVAAGTTTVGAMAAYSNQHITEVVLPDGVETIDAEAFYDCEKMTSIIMPDSVTAIGKSAFKNCYALAEAKIPAGLTSIPEALFMNCSIKEAVVPEKVTEIGLSAFSGCAKLEKITLPASLTTLGRSVFYGCASLKNATLPSGLTSIPASTFNGCTSLETLYIPLSVTSVGNAVCSETNNLKYIFYEGTPQQWDAIVPSDSWSKPEQPNVPAVILYGCTDVDDSAEAPKIAQQPETQIIKAGQEMTALEVKVSEENGYKYYFDWYKKAKNEISRMPGTPSEDGLGSSCIPEAATNTNVDYYCVVEKVNAEGIASWTYSDSATVALGINEFQGSGIASDPYQLATAEDLQNLSKMVNEESKSMAGIYFKLTADITLPEGWTPIGAPKAETTDGKSHSFSGIIDGDNKTITVPEGGKPLLGHVYSAEVRNLNIYGKKIDGYGLVNNCEGVGYAGSCIIIDNVTLKSGSSTLKSGLIGANITTNSFAGCSADYLTTVRNCTIEEGVVVGYNKDQRIIGSIAGRLQGTVENCVSYATVYGTEYVGGIVGARDNAMGTSKVKNCTFGGTVEASGTHAGGIVGGGYENMTAPNGIPITINGCSATGTVIGEDKVGGILGADTYEAQAWDNCPYTIKGNSFTGKVQTTGENAKYIGGIIGFYDSLNRMDDIANNYYSKDCGAEKGIGFVQFVDTNCETHETESGATYINSEKGTDGFPTVAGCYWKKGYNRTDDPLGADASKLANTDGVKFYAEKLEISGDYRTEFYLGEELDLTGMTIKAEMSDGTTRDVAVSDLTIEGYNKDERGEQTLKLSYEGANVQILIKVLKKDPEDIKVHFMLLGDQIHNSDEDKTYHTLHADNLTSWIADSEYEVGGNATVLDVFEEVLTDNHYTWENAKGNYISSITTPEGTKLAEFTNGNNSGWMYTLNGIHSDLSVVQQYLEDGDIIVFHYTDDYSQEHDHIWGSAWSFDETAHWHECTYAHSACDITDNTEKGGYAEHTFDEGTVTKEPTCKETGEKTYTCTVCGATKTEEIAKTDKHTYDKGVVTKKATYTATGVKTYTCTVCGAKKTETIPVVKHTHKYVWKTTAKATIYQPQKQKGTCSLCKKTTTRNYGSKLKATIKLNATSITLQKGHATKRVKVTMANGDSIKSWTSSNRKIVTVDRNGLIRAQNRIGSAKITVTLKSGKKAVLNVRVQTAKVRTVRISGLKSSMVIKKGQKETLKPVVSPLTSTDKVTYATSNKNIAVVSSTGVITAKKSGTAKITVRSGAKSYVIKVTVK